MRIRHLLATRAAAFCAGLLCSWALVGPIQESARADNTPLPPTHITPFPPTLREQVSALQAQVNSLQSQLNNVWASDQATALQTSQNINSDLPWK